MSLELMRIPQRREVVIYLSREKKRTRLVFFLRFSSHEVAGRASQPEEQDGPGLVPRRDRPAPEAVQAQGQGRRHCRAEEGAAGEALADASAKVTDVRHREISPGKEPAG